MSELLTISEFSKRAGLHYCTASRLSKNEEFIKRGISVKITPNEKKGGRRINYDKFLKYAERGDTYQ